MSVANHSTEIPIYFAEGPWSLRRVLEKAREIDPSLSDEDILNLVEIVLAPVAWIKVKPS